MTPRCMPLTLTLLLACGQPNARDTTPTTGTSESPGVGEVVVQSVTVTTGRDVELAANTLNALTMALHFDEVGDYADDGEVDADANFAGSCVALSFAPNRMTVDFESCDRLDGTMIVDFALFGPTTFTFEDDFAFDGTDLDGTLVLDAIWLDSRFLLSGDLVVDGTTLSAELDFDALAGPSAWGTFEIEHQDGASVVNLGTEAAPLIWNLLECACPDSGMISVSVDATMTSVAVDFDLLVNPLDGTDDFPVFDVPIAPVTTSALAEVDFTPTCGEQDVTVTAKDYTVVVETSDLDDALTDACDAGDVEEGPCNAADVVLAFLPAQVSVPVLASLVAADVEQRVDDMLTAVCAP